MGSNVIVIATLIFLLFSAVLLAFMVYNMRETMKLQMEQTRLAEQARLAEDKAHTEAVLELRKELDGLAFMSPSALEGTVLEILKKQLGEEALNDAAILKRYNPNQKTNDGNTETPSPQAE